MIPWWRRAKKVAHEITDFDLAVYRQSCLRIGFGRPTKAWQTAASLRLRGYLHKCPSQRKVQGEGLQRSEHEMSALTRRDEIPALLTHGAFEAVPNDDKSLPHSNRKSNGPVAILKRCAITTFLLHFAGLTFWDGPAVRVVK